MLTENTYSAVLASSLRQDQIQSTGEWSLHPKAANSSAQTGYAGGFTHLGKVTLLWHGRFLLGFAVCTSGA